MDANNVPRYVSSSPIPKALWQSYLRASHGIPCSVRTLTIWQLFSEEKRQTPRFTYRSHPTKPETGFTLSHCPEFVQAKPSERFAKPRVIGCHDTAKDNGVDRAKRETKEGTRDMKQPRQKAGGCVLGSDLKCPPEAHMPKVWSSPDCTLRR